MQKTNDNIGLIYNYLENESYRHFGELDDIKSISRREEVLLESLGQIKNRNSHFLIQSKLFSRIITRETIQNDNNLLDAYHFQKEMLELFKHFFDRAKAKSMFDRNAEIQAAKIIWNLIEESKIENAIFTLLENPNQKLSPKKRREFLKRFKLSENLVRIVQGDEIELDAPSSVYEETETYIDQAITLYKAGKYKEMILAFELALNKIQELAGYEGGAIFASLTGSLMIQRSKNVSKGLYFLRRGEKLYEQIGDQRIYGESLAEMASAFWALGMYKKALDKLSTEIHIHTQQNNTIATMYSQEKLSSFFRNLSRYMESHEWALQYLNSAIQLPDDMRSLHFLTANLNYVWTLIGLNAWPKAEKHINYAERTLDQLEFPVEYKNIFNLEINTMKSRMYIIRGLFDKAKFYLHKNNDIEYQLNPSSPIYSRFLRTKATFHRNQRNFAKGIEEIQPLFQEKDTLNPRNVSLLSEILALYEHEKEALKLLDHALETLSNWNTIHGLSRIYLSKGYVHFLSGNFKESKRWYQQALGVTRTDFEDLKVSLEANSNLAYIALEEEEIKTAESYTAIVEEVASFSGSLAFLLDALLLKTSLRFVQGKERWALKTLNRIAKEAKDLEIEYILQKTEYRLKHSSVNTSIEN